MKLNKSYKLSLYLTMVSACMAFIFSESINAMLNIQMICAYIFLLTVAFLVCWITEKYNENKPNFFQKQLTPFLIGCVLLFLTLLDLFYISHNYLLASAHFIILTSIIILASPKHTKECCYIYFCSAILIIAGGVIAKDFFYLVILIYYFGILSKSLLLFKSFIGNNSSKEKYYKVSGSIKKDFRSSFFLYHIILFIIIFITSFFLFAVFPRPVNSYANDNKSLNKIIKGNPKYTCPIKSKSNKLHQAVSGIPEEIVLGHVSNLKLDHSTAFTAKLTQNNTPVRVYPDQLYWRGMAYDTYIASEYRWQSSGIIKLIKSKSNGIINFPELWKNKGHIVKQKIKLDIDLVDAKAIFSLHSPYSMEAKELFYESSGTIFSPGKQQEEYEIVSFLPPPYNQMVNQLPEIDISKAGQTYNSDEIKTLTLKVTKNIADPFKKALAIQKYLIRNYKYSLEIEIPPNSMEPVEFFLLDPNANKRGHCELFASSMVLMMQSINLPARIVAGFKGGVWDETNKQYIVKYSDAHAWVEVYLKDKGWFPIDPTPASFEIPEEIRQLNNTNNIKSTIGWWSNNIKMYDQSRFYANAKEFLSSSYSKIKHFWPVLIFVPLLVIIYYIIKTKKSRIKKIEKEIGTSIGKNFGPIVIFYYKMLMVLKSMGYPKDPMLTPREYVSTLIDNDKVPISQITTITNIYEKYRYAGIKPGKLELQEIKKQLREIRN